MSRVRKPKQRFLRSKLLLVTALTKKTPLESEKENVRTAVF